MAVTSFVIFLAILSTGFSFRQQGILKKLDQNIQLDGRNKKDNRHIIVNIPEVGKVRGRIDSTQWSNKILYEFIDIKYGESPSGALRFKPSVPAKPWKNIRKAFTSRGGCPSLQDGMSLKLADANKERDLEDCLFLSVSTKSFKTQSPVMVYIHGDFLYEGSSLEAQPGYLLEEDVVLVSIRYRLGPFGFLSTLSSDIPGNAGVSDVILALQWIQKNIEAFGGDPSRVTLFGQVGGAALINVLTMSPSVPKGLFHRVIYQSGSALSPAFITDDPMNATKDIARHGGCKNLEKLDSLNSCLLNMNVSTLLGAFRKHGSLHSQMGVDGSFGGVKFVIGGPSGILPEHPGKLLASKSYQPYPTMGGTVKNPGTFILNEIFLNNFNETILDDVFDGYGYIDYIISQTNGADPTLAWKKFAETELFTTEKIKNGSFYGMLPGLIDMCGTIAFKNPVLLAIQSNAQHLANNTFLYSFDYRGESNRYENSEDSEFDVTPFDLGVSLTDENLYLFPWPWYAVLSNNRDIKIAKRLVALWSSFAATGRPKAPGIPEWPPMTNETGPYLKIGEVVTIGENFLNEYSITVKETEMGNNLVNDEYFENLEVIDNGDEDGSGNGDNDYDVEEQEDVSKGKQKKRRKRTDSQNKIEANGNLSS
ncbi:glutactin-like [Eupeodes corollae]|uniref:glutactin-like n=1 Tax=Eupeodes corollae TaxID=290404 RepID=UPI002492A386|nr:glutactin-like [Eupeodes corollae]